jgi:hypothetical protein
MTDWGEYAMQLQATLAKERAKSALLGNQRMKPLTKWVVGLVVVFVVAYFAYFLAVAVFAPRM